MRDDTTGRVLGPGEAGERTDQKRAQRAADWEHSRLGRERNQRAQTLRRLSLRATGIGKSHVRTSGD